MDKRELILARYFIVLGTVTGISHTFRNKVNLSEKQKPAIIMLDADEEPVLDQEGGKRPTNRPAIMSMTPETWIAMQASAEDIGTELNSIRKDLVAKVMMDATLKALTHDGEGIFYKGCLTDFAAGRAMEGSMQVSLMFHYVFRPDSL